MNEAGLRIFIVLAVGIFLAVLFKQCSSAGAHHAEPTAAQPDGWKYPFSCCSGYDCRREDRVYPSRAGYIVPSGEIVPYTDVRVIPSQDNYYHWCTKSGLDTSATLCLFVPGGGV